MLQSPDLYLGSFLILSGFLLSLLNLHRVFKEKSSNLPYVLLSENLLLSCIGIAFITRAVLKMTSVNADMGNMEERSTYMNSEEAVCNFGTILMSYGPLIVSFVNSFLSLIIDNYLHYKMIADVKKSEDENEVRELSGNSRFSKEGILDIIKRFSSKYFMYITVVLQWIVPVIMALMMYPLDLKETMVYKDQRSLENSCVALLNVAKENCTISLADTLQLATQRDSYLESYDFYNITDKRFEDIVNNVYKIVNNYKNGSDAGLNVTIPLLRRAKDLSDNCMKICYLDNKNLLLYMFGIAIVSYFVPITISIVILTKIHAMDVKNKNIKTYVSRELLYNVLFWTPVLFDTFISITICAYSMNGVKTSILNVIANVYQAVKNFMNTKYFNDNIVAPVSLTN